VQDAIELGANVVVIEHARHVARLGEQAVEQIPVGPPSREALGRHPRHLAEVLV
jgi:hypothetical protein